MFCKNCGTQLNGTENVCPNCGNQVEKEENKIMDAVQVTAPIPVVKEEEVPNSAVPIQTSAQTVVDTKKNNTTAILIFALIGVVVIAVVLFIVLFLGKDSESGNSNNGGGNSNDNPTTPDIVDNNTTTENTASYGGYTFTLTDGYTTKNDAKYGLVISDGTLAMSIQTDYTNSFEDYKNDPEVTSSNIKTISGKQYILVENLTSDNYKTYVYVTKADSYTTFVGVIAKNDMMLPSSSDVLVLAKIINSATTGTTTFSPGDNNDAGKDGLVKFDLKNNNMTLLSK